MRSLCGTAGGAPFGKRIIRLERVTLNAESLQPAMTEHLALLAALHTRDPVRAVAAMEAHLTHARNRALGL